MPISDDLFTLSMRDSFPRDAIDQKPFLLGVQQKEFWENSWYATLRVVFLSQENPEQQIVPLNMQGKYSEDLISFSLMGCPKLPLLDFKHERKKGHNTRSELALPIILAIADSRLSTKRQLGDQLHRIPCTLAFNELWQCSIVCHKRICSLQDTLCTTFASTFTLSTFSLRGKTFAWNKHQKCHSIQISFRIC